MTDDTKKQARKLIIWIYCLRLLEALLRRRSICPIKKQYKLINKLYELAS